MDPVTAESECRRLLEEAVLLDDTAGDDEQLAAWEACAAHPCAPHALPLDEVWAQIAELRRRERRWDAAIEAWEQAIATGYRSMPHPRANVAELLLIAGRRTEADALYGSLREQWAEDVWLRTAAGFAHAEVGEHETALEWLDEGIELALAAGDPDDLLGNLRALRECSLQALGRNGPDELTARMDAFVRPSEPRRLVGAGYGEPVEEIEECPYCGWQAPPAVAPTPLRSS